MKQLNRAGGAGQIANGKWQMANENHIDQWAYLLACHCEEAKRRSNPE